MISFYWLTVGVLSCSSPEIGPNSISINAKLGRFLFELVERNALQVLFTHSAFWQSLRRRSFCNSSFVAVQNATFTKDDCWNEWQSSSSFAPSSSVLPEMRSFGWECFILTLLIHWHWMLPRQDYQSLRDDRLTNHRHVAQHHITLLDVIFLLQRVPANSFTSLRTSR